MTGFLTALFLLQPFPPSSLSLPLSLSLSLAPSLSLRMESSGKLSRPVCDGRLQQNCCSGSRAVCLSVIVGLWGLKVNQGPESCGNDCIMGSSEP